MKVQSKTIMLVAAFAVCLAASAAGGATAGKLITGKQIKNGSITMKDLSKGVRNELGKSGAQGAQGVQGPPGPALIRASKNVSGSEIVPGTTKIIAVVDDDMSDMTYSGNYSGRLTHPAGLPAYLNVTVSGKVEHMNGNIISCDLQTKQNSGSWTSLDSVTSLPDGRALLFGTFPSFTVGDKFAFRIVCQGDGSGQAKGELSVVAGPVVG